MTTPTTRYTSAALVSRPEDKMYYHKVCDMLATIIPRSLIFSPLFLMDMNHHTATQKATAKSSVGLVTLIEREGYGRRYWVTLV